MHKQMKKKAVICFTTMVWNVIVIIVSMPAFQSQILEIIIRLFKWKKRRICTCIFLFNFCCQSCFIWFDLEVKILVCVILLIFYTIKNVYLVPSFVYLCIQKTTKKIGNILQFFLALVCHWIFFHLKLINSIYWTMIFK